MPIQPSASKSSILINCSYAFDPAHKELSSDGGSAASRYGSAFHEVIAGCVEFSLESGKKPKGFDAQVDLACEKWSVKNKGELAGHVWGSFLYLREWMAGKNQWGINWTTGVVVEKSYAINVFDGTSREIDPPTEDTHLYVGIERNELPATLDVMSLPGGCTPPLTLDHKTGHAKDFSSPASDDQMKTLGLIPDLGDAVLAIHHADRQGFPHIYAEEAGHSVFKQHRLALKKAFDRVGDGSMRPGVWCDYCPAKTICPTQYASIVPSALAIVESLNEQASIEKPRGSALTLNAENVGRMHQMKSMMAAMMKKVDEEIHRYAEEHLSTEVVLRPDGKHLEWIVREYENISKGAFVEVLGKVEAEKWFVKLRKLGVLAKTPRRELRAVSEHGE